MTGGRHYRVLWWSLLWLLPRQCAGDAADRSCDVLKAPAFLISVISPGVHLKRRQAALAQFRALGAPPRKRAARTAKAGLKACGRGAGRTTAKKKRAGVGVHSICVRFFSLFKSYIMSLT